MADPRRSARRNSGPRALVLVFSGREETAGDQLAVAQAYRGSRPPVVAGVVHVPAGISLSTAAGRTQALRTQLRTVAREGEARLAPRVLVSHRAAAEIVDLANESGSDLLILPWPDPGGETSAEIQAVLDETDLPCALVRGPLPDPGERLLASLMPSPDAELALRLALGLAETRGLLLTALRPPGQDSLNSAGVALEQVLEHLVGVEPGVELVDDRPKAVDDLVASHPLIVAGFSDQRLNPPSEVPARAQVRVRAVHPPGAEAESSAGLETISILVDKWFAENTFHASEFEDLQRLVDRKEATGLTISLALPALNEEATIGNVITTLRAGLMEQAPLVDEIVLIDSQSTDATRQIAEDLGIPVHIHQEILPQYGARRGKGEALWKSLYVTRGDLILWVDTDIVNIHSRFVYGLLGPMLLRKEIMLVKGFYRRPMKVGDRMQAGGGGRVTELTARPLLNLFYPALSGLIQPLSGEYGGRRTALEQLPFSSGYGVEIGLLIDTLERFGLGALAQVDLLQRVHHNQPLPALSQMSFAIIQAVIRRIDRRYHLELLKDVNRSMKLVQRHRDRYFLEVTEIAERERPPMASLPEYQARSPSRP